MRNPLLKEHYFKVEFPESGLLLNLYQKKKQEPKKTANKSRKKGFSVLLISWGLWKKKAMKSDMKGGRPEREESDGEVWELR